MTYFKQIPGNYQYLALTRGNRVQRFWHQGKVNLLEEIARFTRKDIILDAGCGSGNVSFYLAKKVKKVIGLDSKNSSIVFARKRLTKIKDKNLSFQKCDLKNIPFKDNYFSKAILFEVIEHLNKNDYKAILSEIYRTLKPGGFLYITTPNKASLWPGIEFILDIFKLVPTLRGEQHISEMTQRNLKGVVVSQQFEVICAGSLNHLSPFVALFSHFLAKKIYLLEIRYLKYFGAINWLIARKTPC